MHSNARVKQRIKGFTIVELLIVIVVIAILAAISTVAFAGVQNRARTAAGKQLASNIAKKMELYYAITSQYPTTRTEIQGISETQIEGLAAVGMVDNTPIMLISTADTIFQAVAPLNGSLARNGTTIRIVGSAAGGNIHYWDYTTGAEVLVKYGP